MRRRSLRAPRGRGLSGQLLDSPTGRITRAQEIDAAWFQLWQDQYTRHVPVRLRDAFEADYKAWQAVKEGLAAMSIASLVLPATGEALDRWANKAADWSAQFARLGVQPSAPPIARPPSRTLVEDTKKIIWGIALTAAALAGAYALSKLPSQRTVRV